MPKQFFLMLILILITISTTIYARKPAVDNVVGIELTDFKANPENRLIKFDFGGTPALVNMTTSIPWVQAFALFFILGLPILISSVITNKTKKRVESHVSNTHDNVIVLGKKKVETVTSKDESIDKKAA